MEEAQLSSDDDDMPSPGGLLLNAGLLKKAPVKAAKEAAKCATLIIMFCFTCVFNTMSTALPGPSHVHVPRLS